MTANGAPDQPARDRIADELDATLFVVAGAGSGKTTALVDRVLRLVLDDRTELRNIAAITFTEKAGAELRDRLRQQLERAAHESDDRERVERCHTAIDQLDGAAIGTLHAFAQRVLAENPVEAGLPPRIEVLDEVTSEVEFERRWTSFQDALFEDPAMERTLLLLFATGVGPDALRALAVAFDQNWDLVEERVRADAPEPPHIDQLVAPVLAAIEAVCGHRGACNDVTDKLRVRLDELRAFAEGLRAVDDEIDLLDELSGNGGLARPSFKAGNLGQAGNWDDRVVAKADVQALVREAGDLLGQVAGQVSQACAKHLAASLRRFTLAAAGERRAGGRLGFHDLLVLARLLVRHPEHGPAVRRRLHDNYRRLLLDEFQDTDPIQVELAVRIAAADPSNPSAGTLPWDEVQVAPGRLFVVGDPKQSIYRFRRADIRLFQQAQERFGTDGAGVVELTANFRTGRPIIGWVNATFGALMGEPPPRELSVPSQPRYIGLDAVRPEALIGPAVAVIGRRAQPSTARAGELREAEAAEVAATITRAVAERWSVGTKDPDHPWRDATLGDITVLVPARTSLPFLEDALDAAGIPFRAESSSLVYASRAVRDLLMALRAADDPTDHLSIVAALRSPLFACGDDDLFRFKVEQRGHWNHLAPQLDTVASGVVADGLAYLRSIHDARHWLSPAELLDRIARDRRAFELGFAEGRTRDVWRRLRYAIDQARSWSEVTAGATRHYLQWVARQTVEGARVAEAVLPETDDDAVRIMTIHAAKGLEFPITILSGMSTRPGGRRAAAEVAFPPAGEPGYRFGRHVVTPEFDDWVPIDEQMAYDERIRLLYVATTRAEDHLVVSLTRKERASAPDPEKRTNAELLVDGMDDLLEQLPDASDSRAERARLVPGRRPDPPEPFAEWEAARAAAIASAARPTTVAATALTDEGGADSAAEPVVEEPPVAGVEKRPRDLDLPPWAKGRYGTAVGRAVHGTLQTIDLAAGQGLEAAAAAQCEAEAIPNRRRDVIGLVRAALGADVVRQAAASPHWREVYACTPLAGDRLLEGYIDLLFRSPEGMVVVDYKTAATDDPDELARRVEGYRFQGASYARTVAATTGEDIARVVFLFLTPGGAIELELPDVAAAMAEVDRLVSAGAERVTA